MSCQPLIALPAGPLDIVGDVHGEIAALERLLLQLGYSPASPFQAERTLVFVGDLVDRGPDSPAVIARVQQLVQEGRAIALLGNHELNILMGSERDGNSWFFDFNEPQYGHMAKVACAQKESIRDWFSTLPLVGIRDDIIVAHACPSPSAIASLAAAKYNHHVTAYHTFEQDLASYPHWHDPQVQAKIAEELKAWQQFNENPTQPPPYLQLTSQWQAYQQNSHPIRCVTSGMEHSVAPDDVFYVGGKWRFTDRTHWWQHPHLVPDRPCVIGHYWRRPPVRMTPSGSPFPETPLPADPMFDAPNPLSWFGYESRVFCVDYSAGLNFRHRQAKTPLGDKAQLAALQWPENRLVFDSGIKLPTMTSVSHTPA